MGTLLSSLSAGEFLTELYDNADDYPSELVQISLTVESARADNVITVSKDDTLCDFPQNQFSDKYEGWVFKKDSFLLQRYPNYR